ncbi:MAG: hypothetical protein K1000chlam3_01233 [Chlamydiae bacterium]|nr:hypothetical protein [Chlamydiota bacterium]
MRSNINPNCYPLFLYAICAVYLQRFARHPYVHIWSSFQILCLNSSLMPREIGITTWVNVSFLKPLFLIAIFSAFLTCNISSLSAEWNAVHCISENQIDIPKALDNKEFINLKKRVIERTKKGWCSEAQANLIMECILLTKPKVCVEIGTFNDSFFLPLVATLSYLKHGYAYAINPWSNEKAVQGVSSKDVNYQWWLTVNMQSAKNDLVSMIHEWSLNPYCKVIHATPREAILQIDSIDFLHLLGGLSEEESLLDTQLYLPKVKSGGYILLSNVFLYIDQKLTRMKALWTLLDECEIVCEIDNSNAILFRKN